MTEQLDDLEDMIRGERLRDLRTSLDALSTGAVVDFLERLGVKDRAVTFRLLPKDTAVEVLDMLDQSLQREIIEGLKDLDVAHFFESLDPDDRVRLMDEMPASVARKMMRHLDPRERSLTNIVLGYPEGTIGRQMSPEFVALPERWTVSQAMEKIRRSGQDAETLYTLPVVDRARLLKGVVSLRELVSSDDDVLIEELMAEADSVDADHDAEDAARLCADRKHLAMPVTDKEHRVVGIFTVDDALDILERAETEDAARHGGAEPLNRPYLSTPVLHLMRLRVVWLLVLAVGATLTVTVLDRFEDTLGSVVVLALFVPLLIGTGGNVGNQAATTITRALALGDVATRDVFRVLWREFRVGVTLGGSLGVLAVILVGLIYGWDVGAVIGLTMLTLCSLAASVGGLMPLLAKKLGFDPAVFANPFIATFVDATGLVIYFLIAQTILGI
ncbi:magnesium transporter [Nesterenkonia lacusekhoensis]|uniref:Magnesium transporter MgtE n=1 Tax=Nesterenkonia lacusekhoensis TaxID=150832 RepID=A0ABS4SZ59_9MICC|nr:magnesium transporter [Nesterenkonia lacusekhoensis]MBP2317428.1 magnesium transporter [Nesterenkonia lacusekhoensis]